MSAVITPTLLVPILKVSFKVGDQVRSLALSKSFRIGRLGECEVCIDNEYVGRVHAETTFENGTWWVRDLKSRNGLFVGNRRLERIAIKKALTIRLGKYGPEVTFDPEADVDGKTGIRGESTARYIKRYFGGTSTGTPLGERTMHVRRAFSQIQKLQRLKHRRIVAVLLSAISLLGAFALYEGIQARKQKAAATELFYAIKSLDVDISNLEGPASATGNEQNSQMIRRYEDRRQELESSYDRFLASLHVYDPKITEQQRIILRVARIFGECELEIPDGFEAEIDKYIKDWRSSGRLARTLQTAAAKHYTDTISRELVAQGLPPQFFYLALQESNFDPMATGPVTKYGIAKGMWQFMPNTALAYGLRVGPLVELRMPDTLDERHNFAKETNAAARYLKDLYRTDAQASGFLVMASYNWGENRVIPLIRSLPANPRERNFWQLLTRYRNRVPQETYDYVFHIVSAAVIGENPRLFGFDFDNPLATSSQ